MCEQKAMTSLKQRKGALLIKRCTFPFVANEPLQHNRLIQAVVIDRREFQHLNILDRVPVLYNFSVFHPENIYQVAARFSRGENGVDMEAHQISLGYRQLNPVFPFRKVLFPKTDKAQKVLWAILNVGVMLGIGLPQKASAFVRVLFQSVCLIESGDQRAVLLRLVQIL